MYEKIITLLLVFCFIACTVEPEPLTYGTDACHTCKMTLVDKKFGAEIVTKKGKIYKFDDVNCMINFHNSESEPEDNMAYRLVVDYAHPGKLMDAQQAFYIKSNVVRSPMASHVASFETKPDAQLKDNQWHGIWLSWGELVTQFK